MKLPLVIELEVHCPQGADLSGLIFQMRVTAGTKNPFYIYFPKTSADGRTRLSADGFRGQFADHYEMGLMDYKGSIETAPQAVYVELFDPRQMAKEREMLLHWPLLKHERTVWQSREEVIDYHLSCRNPEFFFFAESVRVPEDGRITLTVGRKIGVTHDRA